ncbi:hypothetical protein ACFX16_013206 [Malus domestica]
MEDTSKPLVTGCWLPQEDNMETWVKFRYERLQDFCYKCGRICHVLNECFFAQAPGSVAGYGEWTKVAPIRDMSNTPRPITLEEGQGNNSSHNTRREEGKPQEFVQNAIRGWRRRQMANWQQDSNELSGQVQEGGPSSIVIEEIQVEHGQHNDELATIHMRTYLGPLKMGVLTLDIKSGPFILKRSKNVDSRAKHQLQMTRKWWGMSIKERCLMLEKALSAEDELIELSKEYQDMWDVLEDESMAERAKLLERQRGKNIPRGSSWPQSAARLP